MSVIAAIPARFGSTRLHGKPLLEIAGTTLIERVYRQVSRARSISQAVVLTDDARIFEAVEGFGGRVQMTPVELASGSDRVAFAARDWDADVVVNVQGDEPLIDPDHLDRLARHLLAHPDDAVATLAAPAEDEDFDNPNVVKVVTDLDGRALYFSRSPIPFPRTQGAPLRRHIGVYGYQRKALLENAAAPQTPLELAESLEQLRLLERGLSIRVLRVPMAWPGVDTMEDLKQVEAFLAEHGDPLAKRETGPASPGDS